MSILNKISLKDSLWRSMAFNITKDKDQADELVQCMYMRILDYNVEESKVSDVFVNVVMSNLFKESKKKSEFKNTHVHDFTGISDVNTSCSFEVTNYIKELHKESEIKEYDDKESEIIGVIENLSEYDKSVLELSYSNSLRKVAKIKNVGYMSIYRTIARIRWEALGVGILKDYKNRRLKYMPLKQA